MKLTVATETIPRRAEWMLHPRFATQALLVHSHDAFVSCSDSICERLDLIAAPDLSERRQVRQVGKLADFFREWQWSMGCHERYEEARLYPFLARRFGLASAALERDHRSLHELADDAEAGFRSLADGIGDPQRWAAARRTYLRYREELIEHLRREEELVIPRLLELSAGEFAAYSAAETCSSRSQE